MAALLISIDQSLRCEGPFAALADATVTIPQRVGTQVRVIVFCGACYGLCMGGFGGVFGGGWK